MQWPTTNYHPGVVVAGYLALSVVDLRVPFASRVFTPCPVGHWTVPVAVDFFMAFNIMMAWFFVVALAVRPAWCGERIGVAV